MSPAELANSLEANLERYGPQLSVGEQEWRLIIKALREIERLRAELHYANGSRLSPPETVSADEADSLRLTIRELRAEIERLRAENKELCEDRDRLWRRLEPMLPKR